MSRIRRPVALISALAVTAASLGGCASAASGSGPSAAATVGAARTGLRIKVVDLDPAVVRRLQSEASGTGLSALPPGPELSDRIGHGEQIEVTIWEAAPATLFAGVGDLQGGMSGRVVSLPPQVVDLEGEISVPFVGRLPAAGRTRGELQAAIIAGLAGKANRPQALVRTVRAVTQEVTVVGDVTTSLRLPLTPKGERLLDAIAAAAGPKAPLDKVTVQVSRGASSASAPLDQVIRDPRQNIRLAAGDVVTVYHQPKSFTAMGAVGKVGDVPFEATGLSLAQALARAGGPVDNRADAAGVFVFRVTAGEPVIYRADLRDPSAVFAMRDFPMQDADVLYVATAPMAELQKFLSVVGAAVYPLDAVRNLSR